MPVEQLSCTKYSCEYVKRESSNSARLFARRALIGECPEAQEESCCLAEVSDALPDLVVARVLALERVSSRSAPLECSVVVLTSQL